MDSRKSIEELLEKREVLDELLGNRGIKFNQNDRIHQTYVKLEQYRNRVNADPKSGPTGPDMLLLLDATELECFIPYLRELEGPLLAEKWGRLKQGTVERSAETESNNGARNTQFELMLYADFRRADIDASVCEPNPDIEVPLRNCTYSIECKRVFNDNQKSVEKALRKAAEQLATNRKRHPNRPGLIALQIDHTFTKGKKLLPTENQLTGMKALEKEHNAFALGNARLLNNLDVIKSPLVVGVLVYSSIIGPVTATKLVTHMTQLDLGATIQGPLGQIHYARLKKDIGPFLNSFKNHYRLTPPATK